MSKDKCLAVILAAVCVVAVGLWVGTGDRSRNSQVAAVANSATVVNSNEGSDQAGKPKQQSDESPAEAKSEKTEPPSENAEPASQKASDKAAEASASEKAPPDKEPAEQTVDIESTDPKYYGDTRPEIIADGKPVILTYRPPHMFGVILKAPGEKEKRGELTLATSTLTSERGEEIEVHILLRDKSAKIKPMARVSARTVQKGRAWTKWVSGLRVRVKVLDHGSSPESPFAGSPLCWLKLEVTAKPVVPSTKK